MPLKAGGRLNGKRARSRCGAKGLDNSFQGATKLVLIPTVSCYIDYMRKSLRLFLLRLLIVSLPMQGIAGVARFECGMRHQPLEDGSVRVDHMALAGAAHDSAQEGSHAHDAAATQDASQSAETCDSDHQRAGCGTCTGCCIGASAPPPVAVLTAVEEAVSSVRQFSLSSITGHIPARIERPPRAA